MTVSFFTSPAHSERHPPGTEWLAALGPSQQSPLSSVCRCGGFKAPRGNVLPGQSDAACTFVMQYFHTEPVLTDLTLNVQCRAVRFSRVCLFPHFLWPGLLLREGATRGRRPGPVRPLSGGKLHPSALLKKDKPVDQRARRVTVYTTCLNDWDLRTKATASLLQPPTPSPGLVAATRRHRNESR